MTSSRLRQRFAASALFAFAATACKKSAPPAFTMPPAQVGIVTVQPAQIPEQFEFVGQVEPFRRVEVRSRVDGIVIERPFTEGSVVTKGQVLYRIEQQRYDAAYRAAAARLDNAKRTLTRLEPLVSKHAVAQQDVDNARSELESAQAAVDAAKKDLDDMVIRAGISGQVGRAQLDLGARVTGPADLLTTIDELDPIYVTFHPSSQQLLSWQSDPASRRLLQPGDAGPVVRVVLPDGSKLPRTGRINFVAPSLDSSSGTQQFRAKFDNPDHKLVPGQFVHVQLEGFARSNALAIPQQAVQQGLGRQYVYIVMPGDTIGSRDVVPGHWSGRNWIIDSGLVAGDRVVVDGVQKIGPGRAVKPVPWADSSATHGVPAVPASASPPTTAPAAKKEGPAGGAR
ncbi:MAG TPA: efflux RND transporter periplasmic adaptor subunit [Gemmatimonadaceae bacterium]|jgi:membrane fusion protein (multidrug efflux system)|nr:efflux RND transporter periplasmic adaptor subunit [Gemmatimonadaceae bacterium]